MKPTPRLRRGLPIAVGLLLMYALSGFLVVPLIVRTQIEKRVAAALHRPVTVATVRCNPFALSIAIEGLHVTDHDGAELASWDRIYVNFDPLTSLIRRQWQIREVQVTHPRTRLVIEPAGRLNIADLFPAASTAPAQEATTGAPALPSVAIALLQVENWEFEFIDQSRPTPFRTVAGPMSYELRDFSTKPGREGSYSLTGMTDTIERLAWSGKISAAPAGSKGRIEFQNIVLSPLMPLLEERFPGAIRDGRVSLVVNYEFKSDGALTATLSDTLITVEQLGIGQRSASENLVAWQKLEIQIEQADLLARTAAVSRVAITGLDAHAQRLADGSIDVLTLLPSASPATDDATTDTGPAASVRVAEIALIDARLRVTDHSTPQAGTIVLDQVNVVATNLGTDRDREIGLDVTARWEGGGTLAAKGVARIAPLAASLDLEGTALALRPLAPWIQSAANVRIVSGTNGFRGHIDLNQSPGGPLALTGTGDTSVDEFALHDAHGGELFGWKSLTYSNVRFNLDPLEVAVGEIALVAPTARVAIDEKGTSNIGHVIARQPAGGAPPASPPPAAPTPVPAPGSASPAPKTSETLAAATRRSLPFAARIDAITISDGRFSMDDRSLGQAFATELRDFGGSIRGLSSAELARAEVDLSGSLDGVAPVRIKGSINPLADDRFSDVTITLSNVDLPLLTPYSGKFIGRKIERGKLRFDLAYRLSQNSLVAENRIVLDQFFLGENVASPDALKLPVGLAVALLRDREGRINLDVPVRGNLDDPEFKYGRVVVQVLGNIVTKAATAPFAMLGGMFGGKEADLSYVDFAPGSADFLEATSGKLETLAKALYDRPALRLEISSPAAPDGDRAGLREKRLAEMLRAEAEATAPPAHAETPAAVEPEAAVRSLFARQFPEEAAAAMLATGSVPASIVTSAEEPKRPGLVARIVGSIFRSDDEPAPEPPQSAPVPSREATPPLTVADMQGRLIESIELTDADFQDLAQERARAIRDHLVAAGKIEPERVFLVTEPKVPEGANSATDGGRVFFGLE